MGCAPASMPNISEASSEVYREALDLKSDDESNDYSRVVSDETQSVESETEVSAAETFEEMDTALREAERLRAELYDAYEEEQYKSECGEVDYEAYRLQEDFYRGTKVNLVVYIDQVIRQGSYLCYSDSGDLYVITTDYSPDRNIGLVEANVIEIWGEYTGSTKLMQPVREGVEALQIKVKYIQFHDDRNYELTPEEPTVVQEILEETTAVQETPATYKTMYVVNCKESITLRKSPSTKADEIRQIPLGAAVSYMEPSIDGFYKISYLGNTGYALASYLQFE